MRFSLVNPNWTFDGSIYFGCRQPHLPLEYGYSKALLEKAGHEVQIVDGQMDNLTLEAIHQSVAEFETDYSVITTAPSYLFWRCAPPELRVPAEVVRHLRDASKIVVGVGPHASTTPVPTLKKLGVDVVVLGECEEILPQLAGHWSEVNSICYQGSDGLRLQGRVHESDMDALPALNWSAGTLSRHLHHHHRFDDEQAGAGAEMETSRGCPYHCTFCAKDNFRNSFRRRPISIVAAELDNLVASGVKYVYFIDEIFLPYRDLLEMISGKKIKFGIQTRIDLWKPDMIDLLGQAGCVSIEAGVESITIEGRGLLDKKCKLSTSEISDRLLHAKRNVAFVQANLLDCRTDDKQEVEEWRQYLQKHGVWSNNPVPLFPYPGSPDYTKRWGPPDDLAWERAHKFYFASVRRLQRYSGTTAGRPDPVGSCPISMRLLMTGDTAGGVLTFVSELAADLSRKGVDVTLATFGPEAAPRARGFRHFHFASKLEWQQDPWRDIAMAGQWLKELALQERPDVLHLNTLCHGDLRWTVPVVTTVHSCVLSWWSAVRKTALPETWDRYRRAILGSLKDAHLLAFPTRVLLDKFVSVWPIDKSNTVVIANGRDPKLFRRVSKEHLVLSAGRFWDEAKNLGELEALAPKLTWPIYVAGESQGTSNCRSLGQLNQSELADWYARASIYVSTAKYEPFGLAVLEAAMSGCALVLSDIPSFHETWADTAVFCRPGKFEMKLQELIGDPDLLAEWQQRAFARSRQFTQSRVTAQYLSLYEEVRRYPCAS